MQKYTERLRGLMRDSDISTVEELSEKININLDTLYKYFYGARLPSVENLVSLADFFGCSTDYILGLTDSVWCEVSDIRKPFIENYITLLNLNNTNNYKVCNDTGISRARVYYWQKGAVPQVQTLIVLAKYFDTSIDYLVGRSDRV